MLECKKKKSCEGRRCLERLILLCLNTVLSRRAEDLREVVRKIHSKVHWIQKPHSPDAGAS